MFVGSALVSFKLLLVYIPLNELITPSCVNSCFVASSTKSVCTFSCNLTYMWWNKGTIIKDNILKISKST